MPNRILKESICVSEEIDKLSWFEEVLFYRLIVNCDDYGRFDGRPAVIKSRLFTLKNSVTDKAVEQAINKLVTVGLVMPYDYDGKPTLQLVTWDDHQRVRNQRSKYPAINGSNDLSAQKNVEMIRLTASCCQLTADCGLNTIQSESLSEYESELLPGAEASASEPQTAVVELPLNDKSLFPVSSEQVSGWQELYPAVDVTQQLRNMKGWLEANPTRRKTKSGIARFITGWLAKEQDKGGAKNGYGGNNGGSLASIPPRFGTYLE